MPIREYKCPEGHERVQRIEIRSSLPSLSCSMCGKTLTSLISLPGRVRIAGEGVSSPYGSEHIQEPYWRDKETGKITSMY
jgi:hypothetical protein